jgi:hydroxypyruvate reductase
MTTDPQKILLSTFHAAIKEVQPKQCLPYFLPAKPKGKILVVGAGQASAAMAAVVEDHYASEISGLVITQFGYAVNCQNIEIVEAGHPIPNIDGYNATLRMLKILAGLSKDDLVLCLLSGGGSSLMTLPAEGLSLEEKQHINNILIRSGAAIDEINIIRKHLSQVKGGRLAQFCLPAKLVTLVISDVVDDDLSIIASGPTVPDLSTFSDALAVIYKYDLELPKSAMRILQAGRDETPKPNNKNFDKNTINIIANNDMFLKAAAKAAEEAGIKPIMLDDYFEGEASDIGRKMAQVVASYMEKAPCILLSGGELTVKVTGSGKGGPNTEFLVALAMELRGMEGVFAIACDTDGIDGSGNNAGAMIMPNTLSRAEKLKLDPTDILSRNDAYSFFRALDDLIISGPTYTNVNDFRAIMINC